MLKLVKLLLLTSVALSCVQDGAWGTFGDDKFRGRAIPQSQKEKEQFQKDIEELKNSIENIKSTVKEILKNFPNAEQIMMIGPTGSGKSTLVNLLAEKKFMAVEDDIGWKVDTLEPLEDFKRSKYCCWIY